MENVQRIYRILDYTNKKIYGDYLYTPVVCSALDVIMNHSSSFDVVTTNGECVTGDFIINDNEKWEYSPVKKDTTRDIHLLNKALFLVKDARRIINKGQETTNSTADDFINECEAYLKSFGVKCEA